MRLLSIFVFFVLSFSVKGQSVIGFVTDVNGKQLNDVLVYNLTSKMHCHTDNTGKFSIENWICKQKVEKKL